jgi:hypothetical protein
MNFATRRLVFSALSLVFVLPMAAPQTAAPGVAAAAPTAVPPLVPYSGVAEGRSGQSTITFLIFKEETGGEPLFAETQSVLLDAAGHYKVNLGATLANGLPGDLFADGEARWLEVQVAGQTPQPRVLLVSVPYAMKAADAATLGGLPASAFALASPAKPASGLGSVQPEASSPVTTSGGTAGSIPEFSGANTLVNSPLSVGTSAVSVGTTASPVNLDVSGNEMITGGMTVNGGATYNGQLLLPAPGTATATTSYNSQLIKIYTSAWNSATASAVSPRFQWQALVTGNNTASPAATLSLASSTTSAVPTATGFSFNSDGTINFAPGQTFPGTGFTGAVNATSYDLGGVLFATGSTTNQTAYLGFAGNTTSTGMENAALGYGALGRDTTGSGNTANGGGALGANTTGSVNTATGNGALSQNTTGYGNTAVGAASLLTNTTGGFNAATGLSTLYSNTTGGENTANGANAMYYNTSGSFNEASGYQALTSNTTGGENTASGAEALNANTSGSFNQASGYQSMNANTTGTQDVANGGASMYSNTTGNENVADGYEAMYGNTTGGKNTAVGLGALYNNTTGSRNTAVGYEATSSTSVVVDNATALGANAIVGQSNSLILGQTTDGKPGASYVNVGVGTGTPRSTLEVAVNAPHALGPVLTLTNSGQGGSAIDFNTGLPAANAPYTPGARILARETGGGPTGIVFQSKAGEGLQNNLVVDNGGVHVPGALDAAATTLKIDHPLDSANKYLVHSSVESSEMVNIYSGNVVTDELGLATVKLPEWFEAENADFRYQLTVVGRQAQAWIAEEVGKGQFKIATNATRVKVSWQITAVRQDAYAKTHPLVVEQDKPAGERGFPSEARPLSHDQPASAVNQHFPVPAELATTPPSPRPAAMKPIAVLKRP